LKQNSKKTCSIQILKFSPVANKVVPNTNKGFTSRLIRHF